MLRPAHALWLLVAFSLLSLAEAAPAPFDVPPAAATHATEQGARELERRLLAPCCWRETLDVHTSPLTTQLRAEIRTRMAAGEGAEQIERDLIARYGPRLRANLPESLGVWIVFVCGAVGGLLIYLFGRSRRGAPPQDADPHPSPPVSASAKSDYEWQLDQDLLDD